jgi:hypothetical protein
VLVDSVLTDLSGNELDTSTAITDDTEITVNPAMIDVPYLIGMPQAEAEAAITAAGLALGSVAQQHSQSVPAGSIISQNPAGGIMLAPGSSVDLVVSLGAEPATDYEAWAAQWPNSDLANPQADLDKDGLSNHDERIWGLDPTKAASSQPIRLLLDSASHTFRYSRRSPLLGEHDFSVWTSADMITWSEDRAAVQSPGQADANGVEFVDVTLSIAPPAGGRLFVQVRATPQ